MARIIGLTGGIASGKSTVTSYLREKGYPVIDASLWVSGSFQILVKETGPIASKEGLFVRL